MLQNQLTQQNVSNEPLRPFLAPGPAPTRIVLVESHGILRAGIRLLIETEGDLQVVGEAVTANDGARVVRETGAMLVVTDLALSGGGSGLSPIETLRAASPNLRVLVLTAHCTDEHLRAAFSAGVEGYLLKDATRAEFVQAIRAVMGGQRYFSASVSARLLSGYLGREARPAGPPPQLTAREREVLIRIALGSSNKGAALALRLSVKTVEKHRANLMRKLAIHNVAGMTLFAVRTGLVPSAPASSSATARRSPAREGDGPRQVIGSQATLIRHGGLSRDAL